MAYNIDLRGKKFSKLTPIKKIPKLNGVGRIWECLCDCGKITNVSTGNLLNGNTKSCGCYKKFIGSQRKTHGQSSTNKTSEYQAWKGMKYRCYNKNGDHYHIYGARGIVVCDRWVNSFENFIADMGKKPTSKHSLDRIDNNGNYSPENCRWATDFEQRRNNSRNHWIEYKGKKMVVSDLAEILKTKHSNVLGMIKRNGVDYTVNYFTKKNNINEF